MGDALDFDHVFGTLGAIAAWILRPKGPSASLVPGQELPFENEFGFDGDFQVHGLATGHADRLAQEGAGNPSSSMPKRVVAWEASSSRGWTPMTRGHLQGFPFGFRLVEHVQRVARQKQGHPNRLGPRTWWRWMAMFFSPVSGSRAMSIAAVKKAPASFS